MKAALKTAGLGAASALSILYRLVPEKVRRVIVAGLLTVDSRIGPPDQSLRRLFSAHDDIERLINERAMALGAGEHPKHRLTRYHDFFVARIPAGAGVLDIGCGYGAVARSIARQIPSVRVIGIDSSAERIAEAESADNPPNLSFILGDALQSIPNGPWTTVVLSNILEHIEKRVDFLRTIMAAAKPSRILIRVPLFERSWHVPMRRELGIGYFSDPTHFIEHTLEEFDREIAEANLEVVTRSVLWGEIWAECQPKEP